MPESEDLRARAAHCRALAKEYASDAGTSLQQLALELEARADRIDAGEGMGEGSEGPSI